MNVNSTVYAYQRSQNIVRPFMAAYSNLFPIIMSLLLHNNYYRYTLVLVSGHMHSTLDSVLQSSLVHNMMLALAYSVTSIGVTLE